MIDVGQARGGFGNFVSFGNIAIDPSSVAFKAISQDSHGNPVKGIYTNFGGTLIKVIPLETRWAARPSPT